MSYNTSVSRENRDSRDFMLRTSTDYVQIHAQLGRASVGAFRATVSRSGCLPALSTRARVGLRGGPHLLTVALTTSIVSHYLAPTTPTDYFKDIQQLCVVEPALSHAVQVRLTLIVLASSGLLN
jgi:hypothetical protein